MQEVSKHRHVARANRDRTRFPTCALVGYTSAGKSTLLNRLSGAEVYTDPKLFVQWWGPRQYQVKIDKFESRPGGSWRVIHVAADGGEHAFRGVNHDLVEPERICRTFEYEGVPGHVALETAIFEAVGNKTMLVTHQVFESAMDRDGMVASGMEEGANESIERLSELLDKMKAGK